LMCTRLFVRRGGGLEQERSQRIMGPASPSSPLLAGPGIPIAPYSFVEAGLLLQGVIAVLAGALIWALLVFFSKYMEISRAGRQADAFERLFWSGPSLDELYASMNGKRSGSLSAIFTAAMYEWRRTLETSPRALAGVQGRMERLMAVSIARETDRLEQRLTSLGIIGLAAPLLGLAGVLWGLMMGLMAGGGFEAVAAKAAPGLLAGALGLVVAAVAISLHRGLMRSVRHHEQRMKDFAQEFSVIVSRQIDANT